MGDSPDQCPECGATHDTDCTCSGPGIPAHEVGFRLIAKTELPFRDEAPPEVRLTREFKGPTVEDLLMDEGEMAQRLPGQVCQVADAILAADYQHASDRLDATIGSLLHGPGFRRRSELRLLLPLSVVLFLALLTATLILWFA